MLQDLTQLHYLSLKSEQSSVNRIPSNHLNLRIGNQAIYDTALDRLYDVFIDQEKVVAFDFDKRLWDSDFSEGQNYRILARQ